MNKNNLKNNELLELKLWNYLEKKVDSKTAKEIWAKVTNLYKKS